MFQGPPPTPLNILDARGSLRAKYQRGSAPRPKTKAPTCPRWLKGQGRTLWNRLTKLLMAQNVLAEVDQTMLGLLCQTFLDWRLACKDVEKEGLTVDGSKGTPVISPWVRIRDAAMDRFIRLANHFGISPAARARLVMLDNDEPEDAFEEFLNDGRTG